MKSLSGRYDCLLLRLLEHDFEETSLGWSELNHVVSIVVHDVDVGQVEIARGEFLVIVNLVEMVGEVRVSALLLERILGCIVPVIVFVVQLLSPALVESIVSLGVHQVSIELSSAVGVLVGWMVTDIAELASVSGLAVTLLSDAVEFTEVVAHDLVRARVRHTDSVGGRL